MNVSAALLQVLNKLSCLVLYSAVTHFNPSLTASYIHGIHFKLQQSKFWM